MDPITIDGEVMGIPDGTPIRLYFRVKKTDGFHTTDDEMMRDTIRNGKFHLKKRVIYPKIAYNDGEIYEEYKDNFEYGLLVSSNFLTVFANPGAEVKITGTGTDCSEWHVETNHPLQVELSEYKAYKKEKQSLIYKKIQEAYAADNIDDDYLRRLEREKDSIGVACMLDFMKDREFNTVFASEMRNMALVANKLGDRNLRLKIRNLFEAKVPAVYEDVWVDQAKYFLAPKAEQLKIGEQMTDYTLYDCKGKEHKLSEFLNSGKYLLLEFICTTCGDMKMRPHKDLEELYNNFSDKVQIVSINIDPKELWDEECKKNTNMEKWPTLNDNNRAEVIIDRYGIFGYAFVLISPSGIFLKRTGGVGLLENLKELILKTS